MDFYLLFKFLHVLTALAWVGGGLTLLAQALFAMHDGGEREALKLGRTMSTLDKRWFMPASMLTLVFGVLATSFGNLWGEPWVILGLMGFASTFITGFFVFRTKGMIIGKLLAEGREDEALPHARTVLRVAKFDYTVMLVVIADMVLKPYWTDYVTLGLFIAALTLGAILFLRPTPAQASLQPA